MAHGIHDGDVEHRPVHRIVETVAPYLIGGFEQPGDGDRNRSEDDEAEADPTACWRRVSWPFGADGD
jgi:hypothetical protein